MYINYKIIIILLILSFIWILIYNYIKITKNCNVWYDGLNGIRLENNQKYDKYKIVHPKRCQVHSINGVFDASRILSENCNNFRGGEKAEQLKYLSPSFNLT